MTSKLKCPYSEEELKEIRNNFKGDKFVCPFCQQKLYQATEPLQYLCMNKDCPSDFTLAGTPQLWTALIRAKQDLEIARKALEDIKSDYELYSEQGCRMEPNETDMYNYARKALEQIEHKE